MCVRFFVRDIKRDDAPYFPSIIAVKSDVDVVSEYAGGRLKDEPTSDISLIVASSDAINHATCGSLM